MSEAKAVVDSSGWIEVFTNGPLAERLIAVLDAETALVVTSIQAVAVMQRSSAMDSDVQGINDVELLVVADRSWKAPASTRRP